MFAISQQYLGPGNRRNPTGIYPAQQIYQATKNRQRHHATTSENGAKMIIQNKMALIKKMVDG